MGTKLWALGIIAFIASRCATVQVAETTPLPRDLRQMGP